MDQTFWQGIQSTMAGGAQIGAQAAMDAQREQRQARKEQLKSIANLFVTAMQTPGPQGEQLFVGAMAALGVPQEQWAEQVKTLRSLDETKRVALASMATGKDLEANLPHILNFFGQEGLKLAQESRRMRGERTLGEYLLTLPSLQSRPGDRFGDVMSGARTALESGALGGSEGLQLMLNIEKARGQSPLSVLDLYNRILSESKGGPSGTPPLGVPTLSLDSKGEARVSIDPTRRHPEDMPYSAAEASRYRIPSRDGQPRTLPPGTTPRQARAAGAELVDPNVAKAAESMKGAETIVTSLDPLVQQLFTGEAGVTNRVLEGVRRGHEILSQKNPATAEYNSATQALGFLIVRALGMVGNLSNQDLARADELFPSIFPLPDTKEVAARKWSRVKGIIKAIQGGNPALAEELYLSALRAQDTTSRGGADRSSAETVYTAPNGTKITMQQIQRRAIKERMRPEQIIQKYGLTPNG